MCHSRPCGEYLDPLAHRTLYQIDPASGRVQEIRRVVGQGDDRQFCETNDVVTTLAYTAGGLLLSETGERGGYGSRAELEMIRKNRPELLKRTTFINE